MPGKICFPIIASLLPTVVCSMLEGKLPDTETSVVFLLSGVVSFVLLFIIQIIIDKLGVRFSRRHSYCGQWVEEMTLYQKFGQGDDSAPKAIARMIGIGLIRYDNSTREYVFNGKTYNLEGVEVYDWSIDYLHATRDDSVQYVCSVQIPGQRSIGQLVFYSKTECDGNIWVMNGDWYKFNGRLIKPEDLLQCGVHPSFWVKWNPFYRGMMVNHRDASEFVRNYSQRHFPPLLVNEPAADNQPATV